MRHVLLTIAVSLQASVAFLQATDVRGDGPVSPGSNHLLTEAEGFAARGGWVVDPQFMDTMGSPYLLAHGLGRPVADASTGIVVPAAGTYQVWVRTKDWVAQWKAPGAPGRFQVLVNGRALETTFGTTGAGWHWQDGGSVELPAGKVSLALHDLTGFEGRCDAILFTRDPRFTPPNEDPAMAAFRRECLGLPEQPEPAGEFDFVVSGGGIAGTCAALSAARLGLKVALVQDRPVLGGNNSSEVRVWLQGARNDEPWPRVGDVVAELEQDKRAHYGPSNTRELYEDEKKLAIVRGEKNITLLLEHRVNAVEVADGRIRAVIAQSTTSGRRLRIGGRFFADCTGDATVGALAGADFEMKPEGRLGPCNLWNVCECKDTNAINTGTEVSPELAPFPRCPWALDLSDKPFPGRSKVKPDPDKLGSWVWESGFDRDPISEMEAIRDWNFRAMYGAWDALKNVDKVLPNHTLNWSAYILGKRESRRLMGDVVLNFEDLKNDRRFPDGCAPTGWNNDLHRPDPKYAQGFDGDAFIAIADHIPFPASVANRPFWIPYRCLYSRNISNLFMAGRNISVTHDALGAVRVMRTCGTEGEIIGMAASVCSKQDTTPRAVYEKHLNELQDLMRRGTGKLDGKGIPYQNGGRKAARSEVKPVRPMSLEVPASGSGDGLGGVQADHPPDVLTIPPDLENPALSAGDPAAGKMVLRSLPAYAGTEVAHALYLPTDWMPDRQFPVIVEYYGNNRLVKDGGGLGYGISGGRGFIWVVLPYVSLDHKTDTKLWWGDVETTVAYAKEVVPAICRQWGGDPARVILVGHSRGAIACNYIGLHNDEIARLWRAMIPISHYDDGHTNWGMTSAEKDRAPERLRRLGSIPQFICGEHHLPHKHQDARLQEMVNAGHLTSFAEAKDKLGLVPMVDREGTRRFVVANYPQSRCTFIDLPYINHTPDYVLRDIPERKHLRAWIQEILRGVPDTNGATKNKSNP